MILKSVGTVAIGLPTTPGAPDKSGQGMLIFRDPSAWNKSQTENQC